VPDVAVPVTVYDTTVLTVLTADCVTVITPFVGPASAPFVVLAIESVAVSLSVTVIAGGGADDPTTPPPLGVMLAGEQKCGPSTTVSLVAVTVTVCATFQLALVKFNVLGENVHCGLVPMVMVAGPVGTALNTTVNAPFAPPSTAVPVVMFVV
jgi:hypothetical protein